MTDCKTSRRRQDIISQPIGRQLFKLTVPMLYALVAIMSLGIADTYFISYLGTNQLAAIGFINPITSTMQSLGLGLGMAISTLTSKLIGAERTNSAARLITDGFYLTIAVSIIAVISLVLGMQKIFTMIGADATTMVYILQYMHIWIFAAPLLLFAMVGSSTFRAIGDTVTSARLAIAMTVSNLILDPLLIFGIGPFPRMEMHGAALATVIAVCIAALIGCWQLAIRERLLLPTLPKIGPLLDNLKELLSIACAAILANAIVPITAAVLTTLVAAYGANAVAGFGVGSRVEAISLMIVYALSSTLPMFIGQNLGAEKLHRVYHASRIAFRFILVFQLAVYVLLALFASSVASIFSDDETVRRVISTYLWIVPVTYGFSGVVILINVSMNVLGKPSLALYINLIRLFCLYFPLAYFGRKYFALEGLFVGIAVANCLAFIIAKILLQRRFRQLGINAEEDLPLETEPRGG